jgi:hypothetical protein
MSQLAATSQIVGEDGRFNEFSLLGGPLHRLGSQLGLVRGGTNTVALGLVLGWVPWLVFLALAALEGDIQKFFSPTMVGGHVRLLAVIPLLFLCETTLDSRVRQFIKMIVRSGVAPVNVRPTLESEVRRATRWKDSWFPDIIALSATALLSVAAAQLHLSGTTASLEARALGDLPLAGLWYWIVCLPLCRFLLFRWLWRIALWWRFLWRLARLELHLVPTHPDGAAGLGYLEVVQTHFAPLVLAISILVAAGFTEEIASGKAVFEVIYPALAVTLVLDIVLFLGPPCVFAVKLRTCQEKGLSEYMELAADYVNDFERKWLGAASRREPFLGTPDLQSLADLSNSMGIVRNMRLAPISTRLFVTILAAALLPMIPLFLFKYPIAELVQKLFMKLVGL